MLSRPSSRSCVRLRIPSARLAPPVSTARRSATGFEASSRVGTHRVDELAEVEIQMLPLRRVRSVSLARLAQQPVRGEEVELLQRAINRVVLPLRRGEALVRAA